MGMDLKKFFVLFQIFRKLLHQYNCYFQFVMNGHSMPISKWGLPFLYVVRKLKNLNLIELEKKIKIRRRSDLNPGPSELKSSAFPLSYSLRLERKKIWLGCHLSCGGGQDPPWHKISWEIPGTK